MSLLVRTARSEVGSNLFIDFFLKNVQRIRRDVKIEHRVNWTSHRSLLYLRKLNRTFSWHFSRGAKIKNYRFNQLFFYSLKNAIFSRQRRNFQIFSREYLALICYALFAFIIAIMPPRVKLQTR